VGQEKLSPANATAEVVKRLRAFLRDTSVASARRESRAEPAPWVLPNDLEAGNPIPPMLGLPTNAASDEDTAAAARRP